MHKKALIGGTFMPRSEIQHLGRVGRDRNSFLELDSNQSYKSGPPTGYNLFEHGIMADVIHEKGGCILELPNYSRLVTDCAKMKFLDGLLAKLNAGNHRVLIFCQMTKMLDILEDYLCWRKYTYYRMDGSTNLQDRRFMVEDFQKNPTVFAFLLSTRAGGLGVNLTAADTVIFYDNDWNPTIDA
jgi:chromatin-remodeling ATPase INO80